RVPRDSARVRRDPRSLDDGRAVIRRRPDGARVVLLDARGRGRAGALPRRDAWRATGRGVAGQARHRPDQRFYRVLPTALSKEGALRGVMLQSLLVVAPILAVERCCYVWIARAPPHFAQWCVRNRLGRPVTAVRNLFLAFKVVQLAVFATWWWVFADG